MNMFEESVRVPFIARCPGRIPAGVINTDLVSHYDFMPTILDYVGVENPLAAELPGRSFAGVLRGADSAGHDEVVVCDEYGPVRMIRTQAWKYVHRYPYGPHELYCLTDDPGEERNRIDDGECVEIMTQLRGRLDAWFLEYVRPSIDGSRLAVSGRGQVDLAGSASKGRAAFMLHPQQAPKGR